ncbi:all-trans retinoic acid-induced differentiation factor [Megalops cyprinoides]|uniref:all-trans retinoic acid-induced differentiation factor n=1 Tax=Megalops cyprinoides TaxID=118141 RepID=UPI00186412A5|nr:all-trans retinoic acid-induced differentiation factor [Megalops cyprinoides]
MTAGPVRTFTAVVLLVIVVCFDAGFLQTAFQVCRVCDGTLRNGTAVGDFCAARSGQIDGRCCLGTQAQVADSIIGLDLSNCSLKQVDDLHEATTAQMIDLSANPIFNLNDTLFQGFTQLQYLLLPVKLDCPGGNASWEKVETRGNVCLCEEQRNSCYQTGNISWDCPENSLCTPNGPSFFQCSCIDNHHGYKCLREGEFPMIEALGILGAATVLVSTLLWVTQRRKAKSI